MGLVNSISLYPSPCSSVTAQAQPVKGTLRRPAFAGGSTGYRGYRGSGIETPKVSSEAFTRLVIRGDGGDEVTELPGYDEFSRNGNPFSAQFTLYRCPERRPFADALRRFPLCNLEPRAAVTCCGSH